LIVWISRSGEPVFVGQSFISWKEFDSPSLGLQPAATDPTSPQASITIKNTLLIPLEFRLQPVPAADYRLKPGLQPLFIRLRF
jgi:hypothetical protein